MLSIAALFLTTALACPSGSPTKCTLKLCEHEHGTGRCDTYGNGDHRSLGHQNNRATSIQLTGGCVADLYSGRNLSGKKTTFMPDRHSSGVIMPLSIYGINDDLESVTVRSGRRRRTEAGYFDVFEERDPLCEWILQAGLDNQWNFGESQEAKDALIEDLLDMCDVEFTEQGANDQCKLYIYAIAAYYDDAELVADLEFIAEEESPDTEYMRCGVVANKINDAIKDGKVSGIKLVEGEDGEDDMFELELADFEKHPVFVRDESNGIATILSVGAMISMVVANTLVKVCRDFDPTDGHWLLA